MIARKQKTANKSHFKYIFTRFADLGVSFAFSSFYISSMNTFNSQLSVCLIAVTSFFQITFLFLDYTFRILAHIGVTLLRNKSLDFFGF